MGLKFHQGSLYKSMLMVKKLQIPFINLQIMFVQRKIDANPDAL